MPTDLHTALQREREAAGRPWARSEYRDAQRATDQALAALETRPTLAEVEALINGAIGGDTYVSRRYLLAALRALYGRGGAGV